MTPETSVCRTPWIAFPSVSSTYHLNRQEYKLTYIGNSIVELNFTGEQIWNILEGIVSVVNQENGLPITSFVQVSKSIRFTYNPKNAVGKRLITLTIKGNPIDLTKTYVISTLDFMATGGDNFWPAKTSADFTTFDTIDEVWADYVRKVTPISYELDGRIATTTETVQKKGI